MKISIFGLGKLGAPMAGVFAKAGHTVIGVDKNEDVVKLINEKISPYQENGLETLLKQTNIRATTNGVEAAAASDISFVIVPTPSGNSGLFINNYVIEALEQIGKGIAEKGGDHNIVITSTVTPQSCEKELIPAVRRSSKRGDMAGITFCYSPEFIALGTVIRDMMAPDFVLIGEAKPGDSLALRTIYHSYVPPHTMYTMMSLPSAELAKIALNTFITTKISFANMLAELCEKVPGADAKAITEAIGLDRRIGHKGLIPATGYGGPCFGRDNAAFSAFADKFGISAELAEATDSINHRQARRLVDMVRDKGGTKVAVFGLTYKVDTPITEDSVGTKVMAVLQNAGIEHYSYDPMINPGEAETILDKVDSVIITTPWPEFREMHFEEKIVIDCWGVATNGDITRVGVGK